MIAEAEALNDRAQELGLGRIVGVWRTTDGAWMLGVFARSGPPWTSADPKAVRARLEGLARQP